MLQEICLSLIRHGAVIDPKDNDGFTPLHRACAADRNEAVGILMQSGASADNRNKNWETPWHIASAHGAVSCLQKLLPQVHNKNIQDRSGRSALHLAAVKVTIGPVVIDHQFCASVCPIFRWSRFDLFDEIFFSIENVCLYAWFRATIR